MKTEYSYPPINSTEIRPEIRKLAVAWSENMEPADMWYVNRVKLASDIQNYADQYANEKIEEYKNSIKQ